MRRGSGGFPELDFRVNGCTFCGDCARACTPGAIAAEPLSAENAWRQKARIAPNCLALNGVMCSSCRDPCDVRAMRFRPALGGISKPQVNFESCTGCGACVGVCPVAALKILPEEGIHEGA